MSDNILVYGTDAALLGTRRMLLERVGYRVLTSMQFEETLNILEIQPVDVVVWCYSVPEESRVRDIAQAKRVCPTVRHLVITNGSSEIIPSASDRLFETFDGPQKFIAAVHEMTATN